MKFLLQLFTLLVLIVSCSNTKTLSTKNNKPNIVWLVSEDNSKHYLKLFDEIGVETPNIEWLSQNGLTFSKAFSNAPVCSVARSAIISGLYGPKTMTSYHRGFSPVNMPEGLKMFPAYLKAAGYFTTNNSKQDYNFKLSEATWNESSKKASWRNRNDNQPFFHVQNFGITHESSLHFNKDQMKNDVLESTKDLHIQPNHPITSLFEYTNNKYRSLIQTMDSQIGEIINQLKEDGLLDDTFIFYYGDHGGVLPGSKGYLYETGLHVPMVVYVPKNFKHLVHDQLGEVVDEFVNFIDLAPTVLSLANVHVPKMIDGKDFLGKQKLKNRPTSSFGYADRMDEKYDKVRSVRKENYKYIRNFQPYLPDGLYNNYRYKQMAYQEWQDLSENNELNNKQKQFFTSKPNEALYDVELDPFETNNLAGNSKYKNKLVELRHEIDNWLKGMPDLSFFPEYYLAKHATKQPIQFGKKHKSDIQRYVSIANLSLSPFIEVESELRKYLQSEDPFDRYWALNSCLIFETEAISLKPLIHQIINTDSEVLNKGKALEFYIRTGQTVTKSNFPTLLYESEHPLQALELLNTMVALSSSPLGVKFEINKENISTKVKEYQWVKMRLDYFKDH